MRTGRVGAWAIWIVGFAMGVVIGVLVAPLAPWDDDADDSGDLVTIRAGVHARQDDLASPGIEGRTCGIAMDPSRQIVVRDAGGAIVGSAWPANGTTRRGTNGAWYCSATEEISVADSTFYSVTVDGAETLVVSRDTLEATGWELTLGWPDRPLPGVPGDATPSAG